MPIGDAQHLLAVVIVAPALAMPAASCRIMPARSISRCEAISASFGVSFKIGKKKRDRRISQTQESGAFKDLVTESGRPDKTQAKHRRENGP
jgi:hypothetical protein